MSEHLPTTGASTGPMPWTTITEGTLVATSIQHWTAEEQRQENE